MVIVGLSVGPGWGVEVPLEPVASTLPCKSLHHFCDSQIHLRLLSRLEDSFLRWLDRILELCAQRFQPPGKAAVNRRDIDIELMSMTIGNGE